MITRKTYDWQCGERVLKLGERTLVMGILNVTPDSFSDGGCYSNSDAAVDRALEMISEGAGIIDIGGESTRPGAESVGTVDEIKRTIPVISNIRAQSDIPISIDTMKAEVAREAVAAGANIINDVSAFEADPNMAGSAAETGAGIVLMHMKGSPKTMQARPEYQHVTDEVSTYLSERIDYAQKEGIAPNQIVIDPGIGFGKTLEHNLELMRGLSDLAANYPLLLGASRKSFIGQLLNKQNPNERLAGSLAAAAWSVLNGTHILRVHDVIDTCDVCTILDRLLMGGS